MKKLMFSFLLLLFVSASATAQDNSSYKSSLKKMMEVSGSMNVFKGVVDQMITVFKEKQTAVPAEFWTDVHRAE